MRSESESPFGNFCCSCMIRDNEADTVFQSIFDEIPDTDKRISDLLNILMECNIVKDMPTRMCGKCAQRISDVHAFQQMCLRTQSKFRQLSEELKNNGELVVPSELLLDVTVEGFDPLKEDDCMSEENVEADGREEATQDKRPESSLSSDDDFTCPNEEETSETESKEVTIDIQTNNRAFECDVCCKTFRKVRNLADHKRVVHPPSDFVCTICGKGYKAHGYFVKHMLVHKSEGKRGIVVSPEKNMEADGNEDATQDPRPESSLSSDDDFDWPIEEEIESKEATNKTIFECDICLGTYKNEMSLYNHKRLIHPPTTFVCSICGMGYKTERHFMRHKLKHKSKRKEQNAEKEENQEDLSGEQQDPSLMQMEEHSKRKRIRRRETCEICHKVISSVHMKHHKLAHTGEKKFLCKVCGMSCISISSLATHEQRHAKVEQYECPFCPRKCITRNDLFCHKRTHSDVKPYVCDVCGASFKYSSCLTKHKLYHGEKSVKCEQCDLKFYDVGAMKRHMLIHTGERPYKCKYCERAYNQSTLLMIHMKVHLGKNIYRCELCPMGFPKFKEMQTHFASHKNEDEATRKKNAEALADYERSVIDHANNLKKFPKRKLHHGEKSVKCEQCDMRFYVVEAMRRHMRIHTGEKPIKCKYCERAFRAHSGLSRHMKVHLGNNIFQCKLCPKVFPTFKEKITHSASHKKEDEATRKKNAEALADFESSIRNAKVI